MMAPNAPAVMLVPTTGTPTTAPPANPWWLSLKRLGLQIAPFVPLIISALIDLYQSGQIDVPPKWVGAISIGIMLYNSAAKLAKEQQRQAAGEALANVGLPVGIPLHPGTVRDALFTDSTLPAPTPPQRK